MKLNYNMINMSRNSSYYIIYSLVLLAVLILPWTNAQSGDGDDFSPFGLDDDEPRHGSDSIIDHILNTNHSDESSHINSSNTNVNSNTSTSSPLSVHGVNEVIDHHHHEEVEKGDDLFLEGEQDQDDDKNKTQGNSTVLISPRDEESSGDSFTNLTKSSTGQIIFVVVGSIMLILICFVWRLLCLRRKRRKAKQRRIALSNQILGNDKNQRELLEIKHNNGQDTYGVLSKPTVVPISDADELQPMMVSSNYPRREQEQEPERQKLQETTTTTHEVEEEEEKRPVLPPKQSRYSKDSHGSDSTSPNATSKAREEFLNSRPAPVTASFSTTATVEKVHLPTKNTNRPVSPPPSYDEYLRSSNDELNNTKDRESLGLTDLGPSYR